MMTDGPIAGPQHVTTLTPGVGPRTADGHIAIAANHHAVQNRPRRASFLLVEVDNLMHAVKLQSMMLGSDSMRNVQVKNHLKNHLVTNRQAMASSQRVIETKSKNLNPK